MQAHFDTHMLIVMGIGWSLIVLIGLFGFWLAFKRKTKILSVKKVVILSLFLGVFLIQTIVSQAISIFGLNGGQVPFSMNVVTIIAVGVLFGPSEGILYAMLADTISVFMKGYSWDPLAAMVYPIYGMISGLAREAYFKFKDKTSKPVSLGLSQIPILTIVIASFATAVNPEALGRTETPLWVPYTFGTLVFLVLQFLIIWFFIKEDKEKLFLMTVIVFATVIARIIGGWYIRSLNNIAWGNQLPLPTLIFGRMITSSYMTPLNAIVAYWITNASLYAMKVTDWKS